MERYAANLNKKNIFYRTPDASKEAKPTEDVTFAKPKRPSQPVRQTISQIAGYQMLSSSPLAYLVSLTVTNKTPQS